MLNGTLFLFLGTLGWGTSLYFIKILLVDLSPVDIVLYRMFLGALTLFALAFFLKLKINNLKNLRTLLLDGFIVGIFNMAVPFYLTSFAEQRVSSSLAAILNGLTPLFTFLLGISFFGSQQKFNLLTGVSVLLGFAGILIINLNLTEMTGGLLDILALLITCLCYGIAANYIKNYAKTKEPILLSAVAATFSTIILFIFKVYGEGLSHLPLPKTKLEIISLIWLGMIGSGICLYFYFLLIKRIGALKASMITYLMIVTGIIAGCVFLNEIFTKITLLGCFLILLSLILVMHANQLQKMYLLDAS